MAQPSGPSDKGASYEAKHTILDHPLDHPYGRLAAPSHCDETHSSPAAVTHSASQVGHVRKLSIISWFYAGVCIERLSAKRARVGSIAPQLPRALLKPPQSQVLTSPLSQQTSGQSSATLMTRPPPLPRRLKHLARRTEEAVPVRVAQRKLNPLPAP